jgi:hypothetical protein
MVYETANVLFKIEKIHKKFSWNSLFVKWWFECSCWLVLF